MLLITYQDYQFFRIDKASAFFYIFFIYEVVQSFLILF